MKFTFPLIAAGLFLCLSSCGNSSDNDVDMQEPTAGQRLDTAIHDVKETSEEGKQDIKENTGEAKDAVKDAANDVKEGVSDAYHDTKDAVKKGAKKVDEKAKEVKEDMKD